jgi:hypothetical protein
LPLPGGLAFFWISSLHGQIEGKYYSVLRAGWPQFFD